MLALLCSQSRAIFICKKDRSALATDWSERRFPFAMSVASPRKSVQQFQTLKMLIR